MIEFKFEHNGAEYDVEADMVDAGQTAITNLPPEHCQPGYDEEWELTFWDGHDLRDNNVEKAIRADELSRDAFFEALGNAVSAEIARNEEP